MKDIIGKVESYLSRMGMPSQVIDELNLNALSPEATSMLGKFVLRREREGALVHGVTLEALSKYKRMRPRAETDTEEDDGSPRADIVIDGTIVDDQSKEMSSVDASLVSPGDIQDQIDKMPEDIEEIRVLINSPGGSVFAAQTMIDMIDDLKGVITVRVRGIAASAGALIAIRVHDELEMSPGSLLMIHQSMVNGMNRQVLAKMDGLLEKIDNDQVNAIYAASGLSREEAKAALVAETWYNDAEAFDAGFTTKPPEAPVRSSGRKRKRKDAQAAVDVTPLGQIGPSQGLSAVGLKAALRARQLFSITQ